VAKSRRLREVADVGNDANANVGGKVKEDASSEPRLQGDGN
jgi:hypothetical protein